MSSEDIQLKTLREASIERYGSDIYLWAAQREGFVEGAKWKSQNKCFCETIKDKGEMVNFLIVNALRLDDESYKSLMNKLNERVV